jgi:excisionase family DNA binding protein
MKLNKYTCTGNHSEHIGEQRFVLTSKQLAEYLGFSERHIANLTKSRKIPRIKIGRAVRFNLNSVLKALEAYEEDAISIR